MVLAITATSPKTKAAVSGIAAARKAAKTKAAKVERKVAKTVAKTKAAASGGERTMLKTLARSVVSRPRQRICPRKGLATLARPFRLQLALRQPRCALLG